MPEGPTQSLEVEVIKVIPPSQPMEGIELQQSPPLRDGQDIIGQGDLDNSSSSEEELPLGQGDSKEMESGPHQVEPSEQDIQEFVQELKERSTLLDTSDAISGHCSNPQEASNCCLGVFRERILRSWYKPVPGSVWLEHKVFERLRNLSLVPEHQSSVDSGVQVDQWALSNYRSQQPFNAMCKRLIYWINANYQASTILMANGR